MFLWYVINTYSGHENKVKTNLEHRIVSLNQQPAFRRVVVPTEQVIETKDGQKVQTEKRVLPGYVLVNMNMSDEAWTVVKGTPGVTGFVGAGTKPVPLSPPEGDRIPHTRAPPGPGPAPNPQAPVLALAHHGKLEPLGAEVRGHLRLGASGLAELRPARPHRAASAVQPATP